MIMQTKCLFWEMLFVLVLLLSSCAQREPPVVRLGDVDYIYEIKGEPASTVIEIYDVDLKRVIAYTRIESPKSIGEIRTGIAHMINSCDTMFLMMRKVPTGDPEALFTAYIRSGKNYRLRSTNPAIMFARKHGGAHQWSNSTGSNPVDDRILQQLIENADKNDP